MPMLFQSPSMVTQPTATPSTAPTDARQQYLDQQSRETPPVATREATPPPARETPPARRRTASLPTVEVTFTPYTGEDETVAPQQAQGFPWLLVIGGAIAYNAFKGK